MDYPLEQVLISKHASNEEYEAKMQEILGKYLKFHSSVVFGDIFLEDLRKYREENLSKIGMKAVFPYGKGIPPNSPKSFIRSGFKAVITCVDSKVLDKRFVG